MNTALKWARAACIIVAVVVIGLTVADNVGITLPGLPFRSETHRQVSDPIVLQLASIAEFHASRGVFSVTVDLEHDATYVPKVIFGTKATLYAEGTVDASVDFAQVAVVGNVVHLPTPVLGAVALDQSKTRVIARSSGILNKLMAGALIFGDTTPSDQPLYVAASKAIGDTAGRSALVQMAEDSTRQMVTALAAPRVVSVVFDVGPELGPPGP